MLPHTSFYFRSLPPPRLLNRNRCRFPRTAFTAIELIGVLAVISLLAAAILPQVIRKIDRAAWQRETSDLTAMANGLVQSIKTTKQIPASNTIAQAIANYSSLAISQVTNTPRKLGRVVMVDTNLLNLPGGLPYTQSNTGLVNRPANLRVMILSTVAMPYVSVSPANFNTIWNTNPPQGSVVGITGGQKADDLCIQRVELGGLFHKLYLLNVDTNNAYFTFDANSLSFVDINGGTNNVDVLDGTALSLYSCGNVLQMRVIVDKDQSYVFQNCKWYPTLSSENPTLTLDYQSFGWWVNDFLKPPYHTGQFAATQRAVIDQFYTFLWAYWSWSDASPPSPALFVGQTDNPSVANPYFVTVINAQGQIATLTYNLYH